MNTLLARRLNTTLRPNRAARLAPVAAVAALATGTLLAGPTAPPVGPVTPTMKTLSEVEPRIAINATNTPGDADSVYRITQPGSYYLTGNLTGVAGKRGIEISSSNVTIDLGGFTLTGVTNSLSGVGVESTSFDRTSVSNGIVVGWSGIGVSVNGASRLSGLTVVGNGISGIQAGQNVVIESCTARSNIGIGIDTGEDCVVRDCSACSNTTTGIDVGASSRAERCIASNNGGAGITIGNFSTAAWCTADTNTGAGIATADQSTVVDCSACSNTGPGIGASFGVLVARCSTYVNEGPGIRAGSGCRVEANQCRYNGYGATPQAGILIYAGTTRSIVMNNTCTGNDWGIKVEGTSCLVKGNTVSVSTTTNYEIVAGNRVATILTLPVSGAISGNLGGSTISDPDANYVY